MPAEAPGLEQLLQLISLLQIDRDVIFNPNMMRRFLLPSAALVLCSVLAPAQQKAAPALTQAVLAGKLIDVRTGDVRTHAYILIAGDRVQSIGDAAPAGVPVTDL